MLDDLKSQLELILTGLKLENLIIKKKRVKSIKIYQFKNIKKKNPPINSQIAFPEHKATNSF